MESIPLYLPANHTGHRLALHYRRLCPKPSRNNGSYKSPRDRRSDGLWTSGPWNDSTSLHMQMNATDSSDSSVYKMESGSSTSSYDSAPHPYLLSPPTSSNDVTPGVRCGEVNIVPAELQCGSSRCKAKFDNLRSLRLHSEQVHNRSYHYETHCHRSFGAEKSLRRHLAEKTYFCPDAGCSYSQKGFKRKEYRDKHIRRKHTSNH